MTSYLKQCLRLTLGTMLLGGASVAMAAVPDDENNKEWLEIEVQLPAAPQPENLINFYRSGNLTFAIDSQSVSAAKDGTVRYTLIATSSSGVKNISYEAIRCETYEKKLYAFGHPDGNWSRSRRDAWDKITLTGINKQHYVLYTDFFCEGPTVAGKTSVLIDRLHNKRSLY